MSHDQIFLAVICITLLILLLVAGIIITFFISGRQRIRQEIRLAETKLTFEKELRQVETEVSEKIMGQFAQELHDNIGQLLTALHIQVENQKLDHPQLAGSFTPIEIYLSEINQQLRLLSRTFNHDYIGHIGLAAAIQLEAERLKTLRRFAVSYTKLAGPSNLDKEQELVLFRIFQEIVQNALRHSGATQFDILLNQAGHGFELTVSDNGKGFDVDAILQSSKASGLRNIMKRARLAGIACHIESSPGKGCLFILKKVSTLL